MGEGFAWGRGYGVAGDQVVVEAGEGIGMDKG